MKNEKYIDRISFNIYSNMANEGGQYASEKL